MSVNEYVYTGSKDPSVIVKETVEDIINLHKQIKAASRLQFGDHVLIPAKGELLKGVILHDYTKDGTDPLEDYYDVAVEMPCGHGYDILHINGPDMVTFMDVFMGRGSGKEGM